MLDVGRVGDVCAGGDCTATAALDCLRDALSGLRIRAIVDDERPTVREGDGDRRADAPRRPGHERTPRRAVYARPHSTTPPPHVNPAPHAATSTRAPAYSRPARSASHSAIGRLAAAVLPKRPMQSTMRSAGRSSLAPTARTMRAFAW